MLVRKLVTTNDTEGSTQLDLLAMKTSSMGGSAFIHSYMFTVLGYKGMVNLLCPGNEFTDEAANSIRTNGCIMLTNKYHVGNSKRCFYMQLCECTPGQQDYGTSMLIEFLRDLVESDPDLSFDERDLLDDIKKRLEYMYKYDDCMVSYDILKAYRDVLRTDKELLTFDDVIKMLKQLAETPSGKEWRTYSEIGAEKDVLEYCAWMNGKTLMPYSTGEDARKVKDAVENLHEVLAGRAEYKVSKADESSSAMTVFTNTYMNLFDTDVKVLNTIHAAQRHLSCLEEEVIVQPEKGERWINDERDMAIISERLINFMGAIAILVNDTKGKAIVEECCNRGVDGFMFDVRHLEQGFTDNNWEAARGSVYYVKEELAVIETVATEWFSQAFRITLKEVGISQIDPKNSDEVKAARDALVRYKAAEAGKASSNLVDELDNAFNSLMNSMKQ